MFCLIHMEMLDVSFMNSPALELSHSILSEGSCRDYIWDKTPKFSLYSPRMKICSFGIMAHWDIIRKPEMSVTHA